MTLFESLKAKQAPIIKVAKTYDFISKPFVDTFIKIATNLGCTEEEIDQHLDFLENKHKDVSTS